MMDDLKISKRIIDIRVAPYALHDTIVALESCCEKNEYIDITVTKEDWDLHIRYTMTRIPQSDSLPQTPCDNE